MVRRSKLPRRSDIAYHVVAISDSLGGTKGIEKAHIKSRSGRSSLLKNRDDLPMDRDVG